MPDSTNILLTTLLAIGLAALAAGLGGLTGRHGKFALSRISPLLSSALGLAGIAVMVWPPLNRIAVWILSARPFLESLSQIAVIVLMFYAGLQGHASEGEDIKGPRRIPSGVIIAACVALVITSVALVCSVLDYHRSLVIAAIAAAPSLVLPASVSGRVPSAAGAGREISWAFRRLLTVAIFGLLAVPAISGLAASRPAGPHLGTLPLVLLIKTVIFFVVAWFLGSRYAKKVAASRNLAETGRMLVGFVLMLVLLYVYASLYLSPLVALAWLYLSGMLFARTGFRETVEGGVRRLALAICLPVLFLSTAFKVESSLWDTGLIFLVAVAAVARVLGGLVAARIGKLPWRDSLIGGLWSLPQAEMGVILASYGLGMGVIQPWEFNILIFGAIGTTMLFGFFVGSLNSSRSELETPAYIDAAVPAQTADSMQSAITGQKR